MNHHYPLHIFHFIVIMDFSLLFYVLVVLCHAINHYHLLLSLMVHSSILIILTHRYLPIDNLHLLINFHHLLCSHRSLINGSFPLFSYPSLIEVAPIYIQFLLIICQLTCIIYQLLITLNNILIDIKLLNKKFMKIILFYNFL